MKVVYLVTLLASIGCAFGIDRNTRLFEQQIIDFIECFRDIGLRGDEAAGLPVLDPLDLAEASSDLAEDVGLPGLSGVAKVTDVKVTGILGFVVEQVSGTVGIIPPRYTLNAQLVFPNIVADIGGYDINVQYTAVDINLWGSGAISVDAVNLRAAVSLEVHILSGINIRYPSLKTTLEDIRSISITGLYNDEEFSAQLTQDFLNEPSNTFDRYAGRINDVAVNLINEFGTDLSTDTDGFLSECLAFLPFM